MDSNKNILNSNQFQTPLPLNPNRHNLQRPLLVKHSEEEVVQSFKIKRNALMEALQSKREGKLKNYYQIINRQGFVNAKEEPQALRIWVKVFLETISQIIHDYQDHELLELVVFKLPWFTPTTTHGQSFTSFMRLCLALFPHDVSYIHKVIKHIFSPHGLFQCLMLGEHRPALADLLWERTQLINKSLENVDASADQIREVQVGLLPKTLENLDQKQQSSIDGDKMEIDESILINTTTDLAQKDIGKDFSETLTKKKSLSMNLEQISHFQKLIREMKTSEDILARAKTILRKFSDQNETETIQVLDIYDKMFLRVLFSFHPSRDLPSDYPIIIGKCYGYPTFFVNSESSQIDEQLNEDDAISLKKCVSKIVKAYSISLKIFSEKKYTASTIKKLGTFLSKLMSIYPFANQFILQNLLEKLPHKSMPIENQYLYYKMVLDIAKSSPENEERILQAMVEKLCHLDVDLKSKIRKFQFSQMSKIQPMNSYFKELSQKLPQEKETKMAILFDLLLSYIFERVNEINEKSQDENRFDEFIESMMKIFECKIFPVHKLNYMQYLPLYVISFFSINEKLRIFAEKFMSFLIFKALNIVDKEHLSTKQQAWNYLSSLLARQKNILNEKIFMKSLQIILKHFESNSKQKICKDSRSGSISSQYSTTDASNRISPSSYSTSQEKIFTHCFIQGLTLIFVNKVDQIISYDHDLFTQICKHIFKKNFSSLMYTSPLILSDLVKLIESNKCGLGVFKKKVRDLFKSQSEELKTSRKQIYNKVSKFMAYEVPLTTEPLREKFQDLLFYEDMSNLPTSSTITTPMKNDHEIVTESAILTENESYLKTLNKYRLSNEEIDFPSSSQEEDKRNANQSYIQGAQSDTSASQAVLYAPDISKFSKIKQDSQIFDSKNKDFTLTQAIAQSRTAESVFTIRNHQSEEKNAVFQKSLSVLQQYLKLNSNTLSVLNGGQESTIAHSEDIDIASSSKDTEYSVSPSIYQKQGKNIIIGQLDIVSEKSKRNRSIRRTQTNIMMNLREENERADTIMKEKQQQSN